MTRAPRPRRSAPALLVTLAACAGGDAAHDRMLAQNELTMRLLLSVWEAGETDELAGLFRPDAVYDDFPNREQYRGLEEIAGYITHVHDWATAVSMQVMEVYPTETGAVAEWIFSAVQDRPIGTRVPVATGREVVLNGVTIVETEDGFIRRAADYMDVLPLVLQLGGEVHMPGGGRIRLDLPEPPAEPGGAP